jgi:hypothetical protein
MYVSKASAAFLSIWFLHAIHLSKVTPRYVTLFAKGMSRPFSRSRVSKSSAEIYRLGFPFIDLYVPAFTPRIHCSEAALQFAEHTMFVFLCRVNRVIVRE